MPMKSVKQRRYLWANHPEIAQEFEDATPKGKKLPMRAHKKKAEALNWLIEKVGCSYPMKPKAKSAKTDKSKRKSANFSPYAYASNLHSIPVQAYPSAALGTTLGTAAGGAALGGLAAPLFGASSSLPENIGRGVVRGGLTGAGVNLGAFGGSALGSMLGGGVNNDYEGLAALLGSLAGGVGGYHLGGRILGEPKHKRQDQ